MHWFYNLKISSKLLICFILVALISGIVGFVGISRIQRIAKADNRMYQEMTVPVTQLADLNKEFQKIRVGVRDLMLSKSTDETQKYHDDLNNLHEEIQNNLVDYGTAITAEDEKQLFLNFSRKVEAYFGKLEEFSSILEAGRKDEALAFMRGDFLVLAKSMDSDLDQLREAKVALAKKTAEDNGKLSSLASMQMVAAMVAGMLLAIALGLFVSAIVGRPLKKMSEVCNHLAVGNLEQSIGIESKDEIGILADGFRKIIDSQKDMANTAIRIAEGDLNAQVDARSEKDTLSFAMQKVLKSLNGLVQETALLTQSAVEGRMETRGSAEKYQGAYKSIISGINDTLDAVGAPIVEALNVLQIVASKNLTARVTSSYKGDFAKIKDSLNLAIQNLEDALAQVSAGSEQVAVAADEISSGSQTLSQGSSEQASSLEEISSSLQEMSSMTRQNTQNAKEAQSITEEASISTSKGVDSMKRLSAAIEQIKESSDSTAKIIKTIDEIAFQTNLLALNAAVEAARAGDAGKGFAVVAEEVRNLAMRSADAAKNTADLIEESVRKAEGGVSVNQEVLKNLLDINDQVNKVREVMADIVAASDQQSQGIEQVNTAVIQMNQLTQQTAANSEESASAAEELSSQAAEMKSMVHSFQLSQKGLKSGRALAAAARPGKMNQPKPSSSKHGNHPMSYSEQAKALIPFEETANPDLANFDF